ncbi:MAG: retroviral-like aspartic protease [Nitrospirae bacterium]|nr:retroviral-like aspartic protease [Nitrospirota bacterium]
MSKPTREIRITTSESKSVDVQAVIDTGSFHTIIRLDVLPKDTPVLHSPETRSLKTAGQGGEVHVAGTTYLVLRLEGKMIEAYALVSPDLRQQMLIGAGTMQMWDISVLNRNGDTEVRVGRDMHDPDITEVD